MFQTIICGIYLRFRGCILLSFPSTFEAFGKHPSNADEWIHHKQTNKQTNKQTKSNQDGSLMNWKVTQEQPIKPNEPRKKTGLTFHEILLVP